MAPKTPSNSEELLKAFRELERPSAKVCDLFGNWGIFISDEWGFPSYHEVRGENHVEVPDETPTSLKRWPVYNQDPRSQRDARAAAERIGRKILSLEKNERLEVSSRDFMIEGSTLPIRLGFDIARIDGPNLGSATRVEGIYLKQFQMNRVLMGFLYHLCLGRSYPMVFSETSIAARESKGPTLTEAYRADPRFLSSAQNLQQLVELSAVGYFLGMNDLDNGDNTVIYRRNFDVIDFDKAFWVPVSHPIEELVNPFTFEIGSGEDTEIYEVPQEKLMRHFPTPFLEQRIRTAMRKIRHNVLSNRETFDGVVRAMASIDYYNLSARTLYDADGIEAYFRGRMEDFCI